MNYGKISSVRMFSQSFSHSIYPPMQKIYTPEQVASMLQLHPLTVTKYIKMGKLKASKIGRIYRIGEEDVKVFLDEMS